MSIRHWMGLVRCVSFLCGVVVFAAASSGAQSFSGGNSGASSAAGFSSSVTSGADASIGEEAALPAAPSPAGAGAAAAGGQEYGHQHHSLFEHITFEAGGGFNGPTSDSSGYITWGGNFTVGAGYRFSQRLSMMMDYQFIDDKLPGALIAETGAQGGNAHIWSFTLNPEFDLFPKSRNDLYVTGGGGFYRKVTNFTDPVLTEFCDYFYCAEGYANTVVGHFSSNQGGWSIGGGFQHRIGGMYNDSKMKLFAEARYLDVLSPASAISPNGLGVATVSNDTKLIPVTFGVRW